MYPVLTKFVESMEVKPYFFRVKNMFNNISSKYIFINLSKF